MSDSTLIIKKSINYIKNKRNKIILQFLLDHYHNKTPISQLKLRNIIENLNEKLNQVLRIYRKIYKNEKIFNDTGYDINDLLLNACDYECTDVIKFLIENGANINTENSKGETFLFIACSCINDYESRIKSLIENGADVNKSNKLGETPLYIACRNNGNENIIKMLIEHGANVNTAMPWCETPLFVSCINENIPTIKYLIKHGADVNVSYDVYYDEGATDFEYSSTPLAVAYERQCFDLIKILVEHGADVNAIYDDPDYYSYPTPLCIACEKENPLSNI